MKSGFGLSECFQILVLMHRGVLKHMAPKHMSSSSEASKPTHWLEICVRLSSIGSEKQG